MPRKTLLVAIAVLFALLVAGALAYLLLLPPAPGAPARFANLPVIGGRAPLTSPPALPGGSGGTDLQPKPGGEQSPLREIIAKDVLAPTISADQKSLYYVDRTSGHILASDLEGNGETTLANLTVLETFDGLWSPAKSRLILTYAENDIVKFFVESRATGTPSYFLPRDTTSAAWSPDGKELAYLVRRGGATNLVIADAANRSSRAILSTPVPDFTVLWPSRSTILLISRPSGLAPSLLLRVDTVSRRSTPILAAQHGVVVQPAPDGASILFSSSAEQGEAGALSAIRLADGSTTAFNEVTIADKCVYAPRSLRLFCGVPRGGVAAPSPDAWYRGAASFSDTVAAIDLKTGQTAALTANEADVDVISPFVSADEHYLFFQDKKTGSVWRLDLSIKY